MPSVRITASHPYLGDVTIEREFGRVHIDDTTNRRTMEELLAAAADQVRAAYRIEP